MEILKKLGGIEYLYAKVLVNGEAAKSEVDGWEVSKLEDLEYYIKSCHAL